MAVGVEEGLYTEGDYKGVFLFSDNRDTIHIHSVSDEMFNALIDSTEEYMVAKNPGRKFV